LSSNASNPSVVIGFSATGVQPTPTTLPVNLSWSASTSAGVTGYNVYRGTSSSGPFTLLSSSPVTSSIFTDSTAQVGQTYYYVVTAVGTGGIESSYSNVAVAVIP
jgi:fibronectin type 3 domain-containing protein